MTASITTVRDNLDRVSMVVERIAEFSDHSVEFTPLRHLVEKLRGNIAGLAAALNAAQMGHGLGGAEAVINCHRPVGFAATHPLALRRAAYVSALNRAMSSGRFDELRHEQELIDPDCALWRQYAPAEPCRSHA